jgi:hypothetical protein
MSGDGAGEGEGGALAHDRHWHLVYCPCLYWAPVKLSDVAEQVIV